MQADKIHPFPHSSRIAARVVAIVLLACATALCAGMPHTQKHENRHEIDRLEDQWRDAVLKGNTSAMDALLDDDYMAITSNGTLQSKDQTIAKLGAGSTKFKSIEFSDRKIRFYGTTAVVTSRAEVTGTNGDGEISGSFRYTRVYVKDEHGKWKIVSFEASRIGDIAEHR